MFNVHLIIVDENSALETENLMKLVDFSTKMLLESIISLIFKRES